MLKDPNVNSIDNECDSITGYRSSTLHGHQFCEAASAPIVLLFCLGRVFIEKSIFVEGKHGKELFIAVVQIQHTTVITPWPRLTQSLTICQMQTLILLLIMQFVKTPRKQLLGECLFLKVRLRILSFSFKLVEVLLRVVNSFTGFVQCIQFQ